MYIAAKLVCASAMHITQARLIWYYLSLCLLLCERAKVLNKIWISNTNCLRIVCRPTNAYYAIIISCYEHIAFSVSYYQWYYNYIYYFLQFYKQFRKSIPRTRCLIHSRIKSSCLNQSWSWDYSVLVRLGLISLVVIPTFSVHHCWKTISSARETARSLIRFRLTFSVIRKIMHKIAFLGHTMGA